MTQKWSSLTARFIIILISEIWSHSAVHQLSVAYADICQRGVFAGQNTITKNGPGHDPKTFPNLHSKLE